MMVLRNITYIWNHKILGMWEDSNDVGSGNPMGGYGFGGITFLNNKLLN